MIPTIEINTDHIKSKYMVSEVLAHKITKIILDDIHREISSEKSGGTS